MSRKRRSALALVCLSVVLMSCDRFASFDRIGVARAGDGENIVIYYLACPGEIVTSVELSEGYTEDPPTGAELVLWQISSDQGSTRTEFRVGVVPPGFSERVAYSGDVEPTQRLLASVDTRRGVGASIGFTSVDLDSTHVFVNGKPSGNVTRAEFEAQARRSCRG